MDEEHKETKGETKNDLLIYGILALIIAGVLFLLFNYLNIMNNKNPVAVLDTNMGQIEIELLRDEAPETVDNFVKLAESGFYDGTKFHRIIASFMIQGGDPLSKDEAQRPFWGTGGPDYKFDDEPNDVELVQGVVAMANSGPNTNGSQFFIITAAETPWLQGMHTAFGRVTIGLDVVLNIEKVETGMNDQPVEDVVVEKVSIK
jgi:cyclophilin family peptidyl-prolyl cis-trans isomerase